MCDGRKDALECRCHLGAERKRPTVGVGQHHLVAARSQRRLDSLIAGESEAVMAWLNRIHQAAPGTIEDPATIRLARECAAVDTKGRGLPKHLAAAAREPLPDEVAVESAALAVAGAAPVDAISDPPDGPIDPAPLPPPEPAPDPAPEPWPEPVPDPVPEPRPQPVPDPAPEPPPRPWPDPAPEPQPEPLPGFDDPGPLPVPA